MYIVILGEVINFKEEIAHDKQKLETLADRNWKIKRYINSTYKDFICSKFSSAHADYIEGVLIDSEESFELATKIAELIINYLNPFQINIAIVKGKLHTINRLNADGSTGEAFWKATSLLKSIDKANNKSQTLIVDLKSNINTMKFNK